MDNRPNCHECEYRQQLVGSAHSKCSHPYALMGGNPLGVIGDHHGIRMGWFFWPFDYDPVWLKACKGFKRKEVNG